jgi:outer membrane protein TolC
MKRNHAIVLLSFFCIFLAAKSQAQDVLELTLDQASKMALTNNTNVRNAVLSLESANKKIWETTAMGLPQVSAKAAYQNIFKVPEISFGQYLDPTALPETGPITREDILGAYKTSPAVALGVKENLTFDLTVSQLIFNGSYIVGLQASKVYYQLADQSLTKTKIDTKATVTDTYVMILVAEENIKILEDNLKNVKQTSAEIQETYKQGFVEKTDADQLELTVNTLQNALMGLKYNADVAYKLLKIQLGIEANRQVRLTEKLQDLINTQAIQGSIVQPFDINNNIEMQLLTTQTKLASLDLKREKWEFLPSVAAFYNHQEMADKPEFNFNPPDVIGVNASLPIFQSGQRLAKLKQKKIALDQANNSRDFVARSLELQAQQNRNNLSISIDKYSNQTKSLELSKLIYDRTLVKYREGVSGSMDLMSAQNQYLTNLSNYYQSIFEVISAKNQLDKVLNNIKVE